MNKKTINLILIAGSVAILIVIAIFTGAIGGQKNNDNETSAYSDSSLTIKENNYNFGTISMANGDVSYRFELKNEGEEAIKIEKVYTSCMCTSAAIIDENGKKLGSFGMPGHGVLPRAGIEIKSKESIFVEATFDPAAHGPEGVGKIKRLIYLETNSKTKPKIQFEIEAEVIK